MKPLKKQSKDRSMTDKSHIRQEFGENEGRKSIPGRKRPAAPHQLACRWPKQPLAGLLVAGSSTKRKRPKSGTLPCRRIWWPSRSPGSIRR